MQIAKLAADPTGPAVSNSRGGIAAASAVLNDASGAAGLARQLRAYQDLAGQWRGARDGERAALAQALTESPFARKVQSTLDAFTRAAWAGPGATPPEPQARMLQAFDALTEDDRRIVTAMQADAAGAPAYATPEAYRARLQADLDAANRAQARRTDTVTLSPEAQARLAEEAAPPPPRREAPPPPPAEPAPASRIATALTAYARAAG